MRGKYAALQYAAYDLDDVLDSARRRIDKAIVRGAIHATDAGAVRAVAMRAAENITRDELRKSARQQALRRWLATMPPRYDAGNEHKTHRALDSIMDQLHSDDREIIYLWMRGLSQTDIAYALDIGLETYRTRRRRLWKRIRTMLEVDD